MLIIISKGCFFRHNKFLSIQSEPNAARSAPAPQGTDFVRCMSIPGQRKQAAPAQKQ
jgi:hypothetical protein